MMEWVKAKKLWYMTYRDHFVQEFFDCKTIHALIPGLDKAKPSRYRVSIEKRS